jgi:xanthine permease XanP
MNDTRETSTLRYAADESPSSWLAAGLGFQVVVLIIAGIVLTPTVVMRAAEQPDSVTQWTIFAGLLVCGVITILQARPLGRIGAGYVLFMGTSGAFIAISIEAVKAGGVALLASLVVASSLVQFLFSHHLPRLRAIITPTVGGTVILLIAVTVFPITLTLINKTPAGLPADSATGPLIAASTFVVILGISLFARGALRLWGPFIGVVIGSLIAYQQGIRQQEPIDFRSVQGAVNADGLGNLLSGLAGTLPNTTYSTSLSVVDLTGVASRAVGVFGGVFLLLIAFCPKLTSLLMAVPGQVAGAYIMVLIILLFLHGLRLIAEEGLSYENGMVVCISFWLAVGFQQQAIFHDLLPLWARGLLDNGMTAGGIIAVVLMALVKLGQGRPKKIDLPARMSSLIPAKAFVADLVRDAGWDKEAISRLQLVTEEALLFFFEERDNIHVRLQAELKGERVELELIGGNALDNIEQAAASIDHDAPPEIEQAGLRILVSLADRVRHQQFHNVDVLQVSMSSRPL